MEQAKSPRDAAAGYLLKRAQQSVRSLMDEHLSQMGITVPQYAALSALEITQGITNADLARECFLTPQTMIKIIQNLETAGLIRRGKHPFSEKLLHLELTKKGKELLAKCHQLVSKINDQMISGLSRTDQKNLEALLNKIITNLEPN